MPDHDDEREIINKIVDELDRTLNSALYDIGFLDGTIGNTLVGEKISNSHSGHALDIAIRSVIVSALLFVTRVWAVEGNSIPRLGRCLDGWGERLEAERKKRRPNFPTDFLEIGEVENKIQCLIIDADKFVKKPEFLAAKLHRDEHVAHLLKGQSGFGRKLQRLGLDVDPVTYDQIIELAKETSEIISRVLQIWKFTVKDPDQWIAHSRTNTMLFWETIPKLSDAEERQG